PDEIGATVIGTGEGERRQGPPPEAAVSHGLVRGKRLSLVDRSAAGSPGSATSAVGAPDARPAPTGTGGSPTARAAPPALPPETRDPGVQAVRGAVALKPVPVPAPARPAIAEAAPAPAIRARPAAPAARAEPVKADITYRPAGSHAADASASAEPAREDRIAAARLRGYQGDACRECGNFTLVRNGTCLKCDTCGSTTGCS